MKKLNKIEAELKKGVGYKKACKTITFISSGVVNPF